MDAETNVFDIKQQFFNNMQLLGFDAQAMEAANHIPFNKTMFELPNKRGSEIVLHFLFERLNPTMCREAFRDCWPIFDKKREQAYRKACSNWLTNISQEEPESHLPRINASLFMSPGGEKFYQMLFHFSGHVLQKVLDTELGSESRDHLRYAVFNAQNVQMLNAINKNLVWAAIRHRTKYYETVRLNVKANEGWKDKADEIVHKYRKVNKEIREAEYKMRQEEQKAVEASMSRGSPVKKRGHGEQFDSEFGQGTIKRAQRIQQVREMWKQVEDYENTAAAEREVVESIVERTLHKYKLDAADISVKVPDMLLRECSEEIRRRNVDNTYQGGKLNLVSVLQLWNLSLHLYIAKIKEVGMPKYDEDVQKLTSYVHVQQNYTQKTRSLRQQMEEGIPVLKESVAKLREKLDILSFRDMSPASIRTTSLGLGLVGPSPQMRFSPEHGKTPEGGIDESRPSNHYIKTPEAAEQITKKIKMRQAVRPEPKALFKQPDLKKQGTRHQEPSSIPRPDRSQTSSRASSRPSSARSHASSKGSLKSTPKSSRSAQNLTTKRKEDKSFTKVTSPKSMMERLNIGDSLRQEADGQELDNDLPSSQPLSARSDKSDASSKHTLTARSDRSTASNRVTNYGDQWDASKPGASKKTAADLLVEEIMGEGKILSPFNSGLEAFETHNLVRRTPDLGDDSTRDSLTPTNDWKTDAADDGQIVDVQSKDINLDRYTGEEQAHANSFLPIDKPQTRNVDSEVTLNSPRQTIQQSAHQGLQPIQGSRRGERRDTEGSRDDDVEGMIEEGIRQVHEEELLEENEEENVQKEDRLDEAVDEAGQFEDVQGPDLEDEQASDLEDEQAPDFEEEDLEDNLSEVSKRSAEEPIVIDKSLHMSPPQQTGRSPREICSPVSPEMLLDDEKFPSLENSPMEAIIIDHSFHMSDNQFGKSKESRIQPMSPGVQLDSDRLKTWTRAAASKEVLSRSFQGRPSAAEKTSLSSDFLSQSLVTKRSPLSEEIRKMFKKALEDTPPTRLSRKPPRADPLSDGGSSPDYPSNILKQSDISWDNTENLEDIEIPELDDNFDDEEDNIDDLLQTEDRLSQSDNIDDLLNNKRNTDIDDFFATKTPELPKRSGAVSAAERSWSQDQDQFLGQSLLEKSFEDSSVDLPKFSTK